MRSEEYLSQFKSELEDLLKKFDLYLICSDPYEYVEVIERDAASFYDNKSGAGPTFSEDITFHIF